MFRSCNERVRAFIPDYKINLIAPSLIQDKDFDLFRSTLKEVLSFIKYSKDKEKLQELVENDEVFRHVGRAEYEVINTCTNSNLKADKAKEDVDMCQAIREMMEEAEAKGRAEAEIKAKEAEAKAKEAEAKAKEAEVTAKAEKVKILLKSVKTIMEKNGMPLEEVVSLLDISKSDQELLMPLL
jgi:topoisomerase IA-like protein